MDEQIPARAQRIMEMLADGREHGRADIEAAVGWSRATVGRELRNRTSR